MPNPISDWDPEPVKPSYDCLITARPQTVLLPAQQQSRGWKAAQQKALSAGRTPSLRPGKTDQPASDMDVDMTSPDEAAHDTGSPGGNPRD